MYGTVGGDALLDSHCREEFDGEEVLTGVVAAVVEGEVYSIAVWRVGNVFFRGEVDIINDCSFEFKLYMIKMIWCCFVEGQ